ncbi:hypothetical protein [Phaeodactylibacter luteus]|uniref:Transglutaminase domain-containing protein n=1 Tax=Phaeodactylibacter luteus TaxID=1564516 RepID=A0A5C6S5I5_9BACT|nr:hypothetical protein [Phaeodactylibacter luteus]TXB68873.1 hypothetical protein FRY97_02060 [Phaeodactylibacter luteus]
MQQGHPYSRIFPSLAFGLLLPIFLCGATPGSTDPIKEVLVPIWGEHIRISYPAQFLPPSPAAIDDHGIPHFYHQLAKSNYHPLLYSLRQVRRTLKLNDWLYYQLIEAAIKQTFSHRSKADRTLTVWFLLAQSGMDVRIGYRAKEVYLYAYSDEHLFRVPLVNDGGRTYFNLSTQRQAVQEDGAPLYFILFQPNPNGASFRFGLQSLPLLRPRPEQQQLKFLADGAWQHLEVTVDATMKMLMEQYPQLDETAYLDIPLSAALERTLIPQLEQLMMGKSPQQRAAFLAAFTRSAFAYQEDHAQFGYSRPMSAEEVLLHPYSDCEDRVALYVQLSKHLLGLPMLVVAFPDHLTLAVALPQTKGEAVRYENRNYYFCDPTGPAYSQSIGTVPQGYEKSPFRILKAYP